MKKLLSVPAYIWAVACMLLIPVTFIGSSGFARKLSKLPFMKIHPVFSGGDVDHTYVSDSLTISIFKPVFPALIGENRKGFVQVRFSSQKLLPPLIESQIDYNNDASPDFKITIDTSNGKTTLTSLNRNVTSLGISSRVKQDWLVRVNLLNERK